MSTNIASAFEAKYDALVKHAFQQTSSKLRQHVRVRTGVTGATYNFPVMGSVNANTKSRDADITSVNPTHGFKTATMADSYSFVYLDKLDALKAEPSYLQELAKTTGSSLARVMDDCIIDALGVASGQVTTTTTACGFTYAKLNQARQLLDAADVDPQDRVLVIGPTQLSSALLEDKFIHNDYLQLQAVSSGSIDKALGFTWVISTRLDGYGSPNGPTECFAFSKQALGLAINAEPNAVIEWVPQKRAWLVGGEMSIGAVRIEDNGAIAIPCYLG